MLRVNIDVVELVKMKETSSGIDNVSSFFHYEEKIGNKTKRLFVKFDKCMLSLL